MLLWYVVLAVFAICVDSPTTSDYYAAFGISSKKRGTILFYVNPSEESKEAFLKRVGKRVRVMPVWEGIPKGQLPVQLIDNGRVTVAAIARTKDEYRQLVDPDGARPRITYLVSIVDLLPVTDAGFAASVNHIA